ncbi:hypothetical protein PsYK624_121690 [Phanerochaete sordida]|uniref:Alpha/beta-hydrolase n=1 Tax=Phanerochaete sordida TaxID=48140 RepID=A0A9P3GJ85_9APHY|nr:hypothetical protein PsYK624_121690 [Phanerochaete sordida]
MHVLQILASATLALGFATNAHAKLLATRDNGFDWMNLTSSTKLSLAPCYDSFKCARLTVPLQYSNPAAGETQVALLVSPSNFSRSDPRYRGPILFNPGGPGGSGVSFVQELAAYFRVIIGPAYDLVGFDPRGVGFTTPSLEVFHTAAEALAFYGAYPFNANESIASFGRGYAQVQILGSLAAARASTVAESVSTPAVAMDMLAISRAFGFEEVNYWGISYGTVLGATFAAMFPHNVGRFIIDGVVNSHEWYQGTDLSSLTFTDAALTSIYEACTAAGPSQCAIWAPTASAIRARIDALLASLHVAPVPVFDDPSTGSGVVDYATLVQQLLAVAYQPYASAPGAAQAVLALERGYASAVWAGSLAQEVGELASCATGVGAQGPLEVGAAVECGDIVGPFERTIEQAREDYAAVTKMSALFGPAYYYTSPGVCTGWHLRGKDVFNGSFTTSTRTPLLVISNTLDPITPIMSGKNMSAGFARSVLLQQNSTGHTSLSGFSLCTARAIAAYVANATLPAPHTVCQPDRAIFEPAPNAALAKRDAGGELGFEEAVRAIAGNDVLVRGGVLGRMRGARMVRGGLR